MPTYDYKCNACSHQFEQFQSMKDKPLKKCPKCGKNALERLIGTGAAVIFKGSGFYQTDYRSEAYKKAAQSDKPSETKVEAKGDAKPAETKAESGTTESKPAQTKVETKPGAAEKPSAGRQSGGAAAGKIGKKSKKA